MPNYNDLILTAADWKFWATFPGGGSYQLKTLESIDMSISVEEELIYAVSEEEAVGNKKNGKKVTGKISIQFGEIISILLLEGLVDASDVTGITITAVAPPTVSRIFRQVNFNSEDTTVARKNKETISSIGFTALSMLRA